MVQRENTILVMGIARSGLTVTMQMLYAGGVPCVGGPPSFELFEIGRIPWDHCGGKAVKVVDAQLQFPPDDGKYKIIRLKRDLKEQAKSTKKFAEFFLGQRYPYSKRNLLWTLERDHARIDEWLEGREVLVVHFERLIVNPAREAACMAWYLGGGLDIEAMAKVVIKRSPRCLKHMLEATL